MKDINQVLIRKLEEMRLCKVQIYCLKVVIPLLEESSGVRPQTEQRKID